MSAGPRHLLALAVVLAGGCASEAVPPANLILVSIDTLRADHLGCYGYERPTSPVLDGIAEEGVLFEQVTSTAAWTVPAHVSMLTGLYPRTHGVRTWDRRFPEGTPTLASLLADEGFATAAFVNFRLLARGRFGETFDDYELIHPADGPEGSTDELVQEVLDWLGEEREERAFVFLHLYDVHSDYEALPEAVELFADEYTGEVDGTTAQLKRYRDGELGRWGDAEADRLRDLYDAGIRQLDADLQALVDGIGEFGIEDETLLVVTSDHGEEFLEHGGVLHGRTLYEELVRVPLILSGPGVPEGERVEGEVSLVDIAPTALSLLDVQTEASFEGVDLTAAWRRPGSWPPTRYIFAEADEWYGMKEGNLRRMIRRGPYKLLYDKDSGRQALYDVHADPAEARNVAASKDPIRQAMWSALEVFMQATESGEVRPLTPEELEDLKNLGYL